MTGAVETLLAARPDGPDEMGRELAGGPDAVAATLANVHDLRPQLEVMLGRAGRIVLVGTGASLAVIHAAAPFWRTAFSNGLGISVEAGNGAMVPRPIEVLVRQSAEATLGDVDGQAFHPTDVVVMLSQSGATPETVAAARTARTVGAVVLVLTGNPGSELAALGSLVVPIAAEREDGASTRSELAALGALLAIADALPASPEGAGQVAGTLRAVVESWTAAAVAGPRLAAARSIWCLGFGAALGIAEAATLLWHEKVIRPAVAATPSEFRHGLIESAGPDAGVILIAIDGPNLRREAYASRLRSELAFLGVTVVELGDARAPLPLRAIDAGGRALEALLRAQQLARATALAAGTYHDGFRVLRHAVLPATELMS